VFRKEQEKDKVNTSAGRKRRRTWTIIIDVELPVDHLLGTDIG